MLKTIIILYLSCYGLFLLFSRQPDYFDGQVAPAIIYFKKDSLSETLIPYAVFSRDNDTFYVDARYPLRINKAGEKVKIIYESAQPEKAAVYSFWGYWIKWKELAFSLVLLLVLLQIALAVVRHPTPEGLISDLESSSRHRKKS